VVKNKPFLDFQLAEQSQTGVEV